MDIGRVVSDLDVRRLRSLLEMVRDNRDQLPQLSELIRTVAEALGVEAVPRGTGTALRATPFTSIAGRLAGVAHTVAGAADRAKDAPLVGAPARRLSSAAVSLADATRDLGELADDALGLAGILRELEPVLDSLGIDLESLLTRPR